MKFSFLSALTVLAYQASIATAQLVPCGPATCSGGWECCNDSCGYCVPPGETCAKNDVCTQCGPNLCGNGQECCNDSCGTCIQPGGTCSQQPCNQCGTKVCGPGLECCNESCGECSEPGGACSTKYCGQECGPNICNEGEECCNESCGECAPVGSGICSAKFCGTPCGKYECPLGLECCNESCGTCVEPGQPCTGEICETDECPTIGSTTCTGESKPVECGDKKCEYSNLCTATTAGFNEADCCPKAEGACTADNNPVKCDDKCDYGSQSCADLAGYTSAQCCAQPKDTTSCTANYAPVACGSASCIYENDCIAALAGFDPPSCVPQTGGTSLQSSGGDGTSSACSMSKGPFGTFAKLLF